MGSKNTSPFPSKKQPSPTPRPKPTKTSGGGGGGGSATPSKQDCWDFKLVSITEGAARAKTEMSIDGIPQGARVMIHADIGVLGYAPAVESTRIIAAQQKTGGTLNGHVTSTNSGGDVSVHLCLS
ncbi:MAG TPA: hypothetical protein DC054_12910 [Blastocatellia bacterium]|nr:hypothetical protein [Blastocatellia bacterium]